MTDVTQCPPSEEDSGVTDYWRKKGVLEEGAFRHAIIEGILDCVTSTRDRRATAYGAYAVFTLEELVSQFTSLQVLEAVGGKLLERMSPDQRAYLVQCSRIVEISPDDEYLNPLDRIAERARLRRPHVT